MYLLTAIFNKASLYDVLVDLKEEGIEGVTISEVSGQGRFSDSQEETLQNRNIKVDIVISNEKYKEIAKEVIRSNSRDLHSGSGKMWVTPVLEVERIRTGETNEAALSHPKTANTYEHEESFYNSIDTPAS